MIFKNYWKIKIQTFHKTEYLNHKRQIKLESKTQMIGEFNLLEILESFYQNHINL